MQHRSPARFLAPLALIAAAIAVYVLIQPQGRSGSVTAGTTAVSTATTTKTSTAAKTPAKAKTYVIKSGDTLSGIAAKTGVSMDQLLALNNVDANTLSVGRKLKLRR